MRIKCTPLGAGQDIGKSCVLVSLGPSCNVLFDCGMHMGYTDERRYPDFSVLPRLLGDSKRHQHQQHQHQHHQHQHQQNMGGGRVNSRVLEEIDCLVVTHIHMDHCGALPYFTQVVGYRGPIYMTYPTRALAPLMVEDYRKVMVEKRGEKEAEHYTLDQIKASFERVIPVDIHQTIKVNNNLILRPFYAGHVLGAAMFYAQDTSTGASVLYTGDYSMTADRHLRPACIPMGLKPDMLITESTYATTIRDSRRAREMEFLQKVHACVRSGGRVLIPVFALGRAQELCILLDEYWETHNMSVPIYFSAGLATQANVYYQMLLTWTNEKVQDAHGKRSTFNFKNVRPYDKVKDPPSTLPPCVLFATPGMLTGGLSLEAFICWAPDPNNLIVLPGICLAGTVGRKLQALAAGGPAGGASTGSSLAASGGGRIPLGGGAPASGGVQNKLTVDKHTEVRVSCQVHQLSFSPHTDSKGIMDLTRAVSPKHVMLVHGEKAKMAKLKARISDDLGIPCFDPANLSTITVPFTPSSPILLSATLALRSLEAQLTTGLEALLEAHLESDREANEGAHPVASDHPGTGSNTLSRKSVRMSDEDPPVALSAGALEGRDTGDHAQSGLPMRAQGADGSGQEQTIPNGTAGARNGRAVAVRSGANRIAAVLVRETSGVQLLLDPTELHTTAAAAAAGGGEATAAAARGGAATAAGGDAGAAAAGEAAAAEEAAAAGLDGDTETTPLTAFASVSSLGCASPSPGATPPKASVLIQGHTISSPGTSKQERTGMSFPPDLNLTGTEETSIEQASAQGGFPVAALLERGSGVKEDGTGMSEGRSWLVPGAEADGSDAKKQKVKETKEDRG